MSMTVCLHVCCKNFGYIGFNHKYVYLMLTSYWSRTDFIHQNWQVFHFILTSHSAPFDLDHNLCSIAPRPYVIHKPRLTSCLHMLQLSHDIASIAFSRVNGSNGCVHFEQSCAFACHVLIVVSGRDRIRIKSTYTRDH